MGISLLKNAERKTRLFELGYDAQYYLFEASDDYKNFKQLLNEVNGKISTVYKNAGLNPPLITPVEIIKASDTGDQPVVADISKILADIDDLFTTVKYLVPGASKFLVASGAMVEDTASKIISEFTIPLFDKQFTGTLGDIAGKILGGILGGFTVSSVYPGIDAIQGKIAMDKLSKGIKQVFPMRAGTRLSQKKAATLLSSLQAVKATLDAIEGFPLTEAMIQKIIKKAVNHSLIKMKSITPTSIAAELKKLDNARRSWTLEDHLN